MRVPSHQVGLLHIQSCNTNNPDSPPVFPKPRILLLILLTVLLTQILLCQTTSLQANEPTREPVSPMDMTQNIRSIISENCVFCHGPDESTRKADLRLDTQQGIESVIEKGSSMESELVRRLTSEDPDEVMPPPDSNRSLSADEIAMVQGWIDAGLVANPLGIPTLETTPDPDS